MEDDISRISLTTRKVFKTNTQKILFPQPPLFKYIPTVATIGLHHPLLSLPSSSSSTSPSSSITTTEHINSPQLTVKEEDIASSASTSSVSSNSTTPATSPSPSSPSSSATITPITLAEPVTPSPAISTTTTNATAIATVAASTDSIIPTVDSTITSLEPTTTSTTISTESATSESTITDSTVTESTTTAKNIILTTSFSENTATDKMPTLIEQLQTERCSSSETVIFTDIESSKKMKLNTLASKKTIITNKDRVLLSPQLPPVKRSSKLPLRKSVSTPLSKSTSSETSALLKKPTIPTIIKRPSNNDTTVRKKRDDTRIPSRKLKEEEEEDEPAPKPISLKEKRARQAKRQDQVKFWRVREEREARQRRLLERKMLINQRADPTASTTEETVMKKGVKFNLKRNRVIEIPMVDDQTNA